MRSEEKTNFHLFKAGGSGEFLLGTNNWVYLFKHFRRLLKYKNALDNYSLSPKVIQASSGIQ